MAWPIGCLALSPVGCPCPLLGTRGVSAPALVSDLNFDLGWFSLLVFIGDLMYAMLLVVHVFGWKSHFSPPNRLLGARGLKTP